MFFDASLSAALKTLYKKTLFRIIAVLMVFLFGLNMGLAPLSMAQVAYLPAAGTMVDMTPKFDPMIVKGIKFYVDNPFKFDFIVDTGDESLSHQQIKDQGQRLASYFLASLTTPEKEMWVNLSPYEKSRIIPTALGDTEMGKELLSEDYMLKQIMATALYPERQLGKEFWQRVYAQAQREFGTTNVPVSTYNKVWIVPDKAVVYENSALNSVFVVQSSLKVMLEQDYLAANKHKAIEQYGLSASVQRPNTLDVAKFSPISSLSSKIIKQVVIPALEKEVNTAKNFAGLRQVYQSLILAAWYKKNITDNVLSQGYVDRDKTLGVDTADKHIIAKIYRQYLKAYRKGVYNYIKEELDPATQQIIPRKYFSGGFDARLAPNLAMASTKQVNQFDALLSNQAMSSKLLQIGFVALPLLAGGLASIGGAQAASIQKAHGPIATAGIEHVLTAREKLNIIADHDGLKIGTQIIHSNEINDWSRKLHPHQIVNIEGVPYTVTTQTTGLNQIASDVFEKYPNLEAGVHPTSQTSVASTTLAPQAVPSHGTVGAIAAPMAPSAPALVPLTIPAPEAAHAPAAGAQSAPTLEVSDHKSLNAGDIVNNHWGVQVHIVSNPSTPEQSYQLILPGGQVNNSGLQGYEHAIESKNLPMMNSYLANVTAYPTGPWIVDLVNATIAFHVFEQTFTLGGVSPGPPSSTSSSAGGSGPPVGELEGLSHGTLKNVIVGAQTGMVYIIFHQNAPQIHLPGGVTVDHPILEGQKVTIWTFAPGILPQMEALEEMKAVVRNATIVGPVLVGPTNSQPTSLLPMSETNRTIVDNADRLLELARHVANKYLDEENLKGLALAVQRAKEKGLAGDNDGVSDAFQNARVYAWKIVSLRFPGVPYPQFDTFGLGIRRLEGEVQETVNDRNDPPIYNTPVQVAALELAGEIYRIRAVELNIKNEGQDSHKRLEDQLAQLGGTGPSRNSVIIENVHQLLILATQIEGKDGNDDNVFSLKVAYQSVEEKGHSGDYDGVIDAQQMAGIYAWKMAASILPGLLYPQFDNFHQGVEQLKEVVDLVANDGNNPIYDPVIRRAALELAVRVYLVRAGELKNLSPTDLQILEALRKQTAKLGESKLSSNKAMLTRGGIDLEKLILNTKGSGVRTAFSDPRILQMVLNAKGLFPQVESIEFLTVPMVNRLLGYLKDMSANENSPVNKPVIALSKHQ